MENPLYIFKDKAKRLQIQKDLQLRQIIHQTIAVNTFKSKSNTFKFNKLNQLLKSHSLYDNMVTDSNRNLLNKMPYLIFGVVESIFVDEEKSEKTKEYGCGILIDSSVVLLPAKNLIFDNAAFANEDQQPHEESKENSKSKSNTKEKGDFNFKLFEIEFKPLNIAPEYRAYLPKAIKVIDHYTPLTSEEEKTDEEKLMNGWGLAFLEYPIGDFLNFILKKETPSIMESVTIKPLANSELEQAEIHFLECFPKSNEVETMNNMENDVEVTSLYDFHESIYDMNFDTNLIYLNNPYQNQKIEEEVLPGFIIGTYMRKYYLVGMNTNTMIKFSLNEENNNTASANPNASPDANANNNPSKNDSLENKDKTKDHSEGQGNIDINANNENDEGQSPIYHIAIRFTKSLAEEINHRIVEFNNHYPNQCNFNVRIFNELNKAIRSKSDLIQLLKNNCTNLYSLINKIKENKSIPSGDKQVLNFEYGRNIKFIQFALMLIWNKYTSSIIESKIIDIEKINCGFFPGSDIISEIIQSKESLMTLNLKNNELFSNGIKAIMEPIFNKKKILDIGKELKCLCLDSNKLDGKSMKYIRHLVKVSPQLGLLSLSNNYITGTSLRHLLNATKGKDSLEILYLNFNMIGSKSGPNLETLLGNLPNLRELNLSSNVLGDTSVPFIVTALKENDKLETLILSNNDFTAASAENLASLLSNNHSLKMLWLNNNDFKAEGIEIISQALSTKLVLEEINLNSTNASDLGGAKLFENLKMNKSIRRLFINCNGLEHQSMEKFGELLKMDNEDENRQGLEMISLSGNFINDECVNYFVEEIMQHRNIKEIKLNSNFITDEAGEFLLYAALQNPSITKVNLENNQTTWMVNNSNFKSIRSDIQIFF